MLPQEVTVINGSGGAGEVGRFNPWLWVAAGVAKTPKRRFCRDCGHEPPRATVFERCVRCGGQMRVIRRR